MSEDVVKKSSKQRYVWLVMALIIVVGVGGYFASKTGLDKVLVKQQLDAFAQNVEQSTESSPVQMSFAYDDVRIAGGFTNRHAIIINPRFTEVEVGDGATTVYRTSEVLVRPKSANMKSLELEIAKPIEVFSDADAKMRVANIIQRTAIMVSVAPETKDGTSYIRQTIKVPDAFLIDGPADAASDPWNKLTLTLAPGGTITRSMLEGNAEWTSPGDSRIALKNIKLTPDAAPQDAIAVEIIEGDFSNVLNDKKLNTVAAELIFGPVTSSAEILPYGPLSFDMKLMFEGVLERTPEAFADAKATESSLKLSNFAIKAKDAALFMSADFVANAADMLPVGTANISVENLQFVLSELRKQGALRDRDERILAAVIERATGKKLADNKDLSIDIKRVRDGAFQIGQSTFEEIMAAVLGGALGRDMPAPTQSKPAPIPAPEKIIAPPTQG